MIQLSTASRSLEETGLSKPASMTTDLTAASDSALLRFTRICVGPNVDFPERLLAHVLDEETRAFAASAESLELQRWTRVARGCRDYLEPLEATHWWAAARAAEHAWADPAFCVDPAAVRAQLDSGDRVAALLAVMPAVDRIALVLHDVEGLPATAVAQIMRSSQEAARDRLRRGRMSLVCALDPKSGSSASAEIGWPGTGACASARSSVTAARNDDLRDGSATSGHLAECVRCSALASALADVVGYLAGLSDTRRSV